jgi:hypothetical protein
MLQTICYCFPMLSPNVSNHRQTHHRLCLPLIVIFSAILNKFLSMKCFTVSWQNAFKITRTARIIRAFGEIRERRQTTLVKDSRNKLLPNLAASLQRKCGTSLFRQFVVESKKKSKKLVISSFFQ